jgi:transcriptional regulator with XRE-family HTH domain
MDTYQATLRRYLARPGVTQSQLAERIGKTQVAVHRYAEGDRFPDADTARAIDKETGGDVAFDVWQREFLARSGLAA